jgi:hypothetical protein
VTATATATAGVAGMTRRLIASVIVGRDVRCDDLRLQRLVLQCVEEPGPGIAPRGLPAHDHGAGGFVELAGDPGVEADAGEAALHVAALGLVEAELVFGDLAGFLGESASDLNVPFG